jgi:hypothetical protein
MREARDVNEAKEAKETRQAAEAGRARGVRRQERKGRGKGVSKNKIGPFLERPSTNYRNDGFDYFNFFVTCYQRFSRWFRNW